MKKKKVATLIAVLLVAVLSMTVTAYAVNFDLAYTLLVPNGPSKYSGHGGYKTDRDTYCYITTTGGTVISEALYYRMRGQESTEASGYSVNYPATELSLSQRGTISKLMLQYVDNTYGNYRTNIRNGDYADYEFCLATSLHSGSGTYTRTLNGVWNP